MKDLGLGMLVFGGMFLVMTLVCDFIMRERKAEYDKMRFMMYTIVYALITAAGAAITFL